MNSYATIGKGTITWNFTNLYGCTIGENCIIASYVEIGEGVVIGNGCKIGAGVFIPPGVTIGDNVFVGPHTVFTNDINPNASGYWILSKTKVYDEVSIGANCSILAGITIGTGAIIGIGSVVTRSVLERTKVFGNPAKIHK